MKAQEKASDNLVCIPKLKTPNLVFSPERHSAKHPEWAKSNETNLSLWTFTDNENKSTSTPQW